MASTSTPSMRLLVLLAATMKTAYAALALPSVLTTRGHNATAYVVRTDGSARAADAVFMVAARRTRRRIDGVNGGAIDARTSRRSNIDQCNFSRVMSASNELDVDGSLQK